MKNVISVDTAGIYVESDINVDELNTYLDDITQDIFNFPNYLHLEQDSYDAAFFRDTKGKQYILKDGDKLKFHGVSFKGSHLPRFWDTLMEQISIDMFNGNTKRKEIDITKYSIDDLAQSIKVKDESSYKNKSSLSMQLIQKAKIELGIELTNDDQLSYVKCRTGYELIVPGKEYNIDYKYYKDIVDKIYERLDIQDSRQVRFK